MRHSYQKGAKNGIFHRFRGAKCNVLGIRGAKNINYLLLVRILRDLVEISGCVSLMFEPVCPYIIMVWTQSLSLHERVVSGMMDGECVSLRLGAVCGMMDGRSGRSFRNARSGGCGV